MVETTPGPFTVRCPRASGPETHFLKTGEGEGELEVVTSVLLRVPPKSRRTGKSFVCVNPGHTDLPSPAGLDSPSCVLWERTLTWTRVWTRDDRSHSDTRPTRNPSLEPFPGTTPGFSSGKSV